MQLTTQEATVDLRARRRSSQQWREMRFVLIWLTPIVTVFVIFAVVPVVWGIVLSFYSYSPLSIHNPFTGLKNYNQLLGDSVFIKSVKNTLQFVFIAVPANLVTTLLIAVGINKVRSRFLRNTLRTMFFLPTIAPVSAAALIWATMYNTNGGLFDTILQSVGLPSVNWLGDPHVAMISIIITTLWADIGYNIVIFMAGLDAIPATFYEAAAIDGAGRWRMFRHITLPLLSRTSLFVTVMTVISYFQVFTQAQVMTNGDPQNSTRVLTLHIYTTAFQYMDMGYASAMATILLLIIFVITLIQIKLGKSGWEY